MQQYAYSFKAGIIICGSIRKLLYKLQFTHSKFTWWEDKGWLEHKFVINGDLETIRWLKDVLQLNYGD
jgi:hypothetical protein